MPPGSPTGQASHSVGDAHVIGDPADSGLGDRDYIMQRVCYDGHYVQTDKQMPSSPITENSR